MKKENGIEISLKLYGCLGLAIGITSWPFFAMVDLSRNSGEWMKKQWLRIREEAQVVK